MSSAARDSFAASLPALLAAQAMVHEAPPDPAPGSIRDALADDAAARVDRAVDMMRTAVTGYNQRLAGIVEARMRGPKARKGTRFWSDQVKSVSGVGVNGSVATYSGVEHKALDATYVLPDKTVDEIADAVRPVGLRIVADASSHVARSLGRPNTGLAAFDWSMIEAAVDSAVEQMLGAAHRQAQEVRRAVLDADSTAEDLDAAINRVSEAVRRGGNWLQIYGRTLATALAGDAAVGAARALGVTHMQWLSRRDDRVRPTHRHADGQVRMVGAKYQVGAFRLRFPGDPSVLPEGIGEVVNCFVAETRVEAPDVEASFRASYIGDLITIRTAAGRILTGTPNHPVLTERGWIGLGELHEGDRVVSARGSEQVSARIDPDVQTAPATLGEIHNALSVAMVSSRVVGSSVNFYGDRPAGEVDVVATDRPLWFGHQATFGEQGSQRGLPGRHEASQLNTSGSDLGALVIADHSTTNSSMGSGNKCISVSLIEPAPPGSTSVTATTRLDISGEQVSADSGAVDAEAESEGLLRLACEVASSQRISIEHMEVLAVTPGIRSAAQGLVGLYEPLPNGRGGYADLLADACRGLAGAIEADHIVDVQRHAFRGHVYTLQTGTGVYLAEGIITKNCRCGLLFAKPLEGWSRAVELTQEGTPGAARQLLAAPPVVGEMTNDDPQLGGISIPEVRVPSDVVAYRSLDAELPVEPGQRLSWPGTLALTLALPAAGAAVLAVAIPVGAVVGVAAGAVVLPAGAALVVVSVSDGQIVAQPVMPQPV